MSPAVLNTASLGRHEPLFAPFHHVSPDIEDGLLQSSVVVQRTPNAPHSSDGV